MDPDGLAAPEAPDGQVEKAVPSIAAPAWLTHDVQRLAAWLPAPIRQLGLTGAYNARWATLPADIQAELKAWNIPPWMIALVPTDAGTEAEIEKQLRFMADLAGDPAANPIAARAEQLLLFGGSTQLPTPGDSQTGVSLGAEGCTAAIAKYVIAQLEIEFPSELSGLSSTLATVQLSSQMEQLFTQAAAAGVVEMEDVPFEDLQPSDFQPGTITIAEKPGGTHVFAWTRVPAGWNWDPSDMMAIGNTGLPQYGDRMILAQEYVTGNPDAPGELEHNQHGPVNSTDIIYVDGEPDPSDPRTNPYAVAGSDFVLIRFR